jgi:hypothetical protein
MDFMKFLLEQGVIIAAGLYVIGTFLKKASFLPDWLIPFILTVLGVLAAGFSMDGGFSVDNILQGVFATGAAVLANQIKKQATVQDVGDDYANKIEQRTTVSEESTNVDADGETAADGDTSNTTDADDNEDTTDGGE